MEITAEDAEFPSTPVPVDAQPEPLPGAPEPSEEGALR